MKLQLKGKIYGKRDKIVNYIFFPTVLISLFLITGGRRNTKSIIEHLGLDYMFFPLLVILLVSIAILILNSYQTDKSQLITFSDSDICIDRKRICYSVQDIKSISVVCNDEKVWEVKFTYNNEVWDLYLTIDNQNELDSFQELIKKWLTLYPDSFNKTLTKVPS